MSTFLYYLAASALCGLSTILIRNATTYTMATNATSESRMRLRVLGRVLIAFAAVSAGMGAFAQITSFHH